MLANILYKTLSWFCFCLFNVQCSSFSITSLSFLFCRPTSFGMVAQSICWIFLWWLAGFRWNKWALTDTLDEQCPFNCYKVAYSSRHFRVTARCMALFHTRYLLLSFQNAHVILYRCLRPPSVCIVYALTNISLHLELKMLIIIVVQNEWICWLSCSCNTRTYYPIVIPYAASEQRVRKKLKTQH